MFDFILLAQASENVVLWLSWTSVSPSVVMSAQLCLFYVLSSTAAHKVDLVTGGGKLLLHIPSLTFFLQEIKFESPEISPD